MKKTRSYKESLSGQTPALLASIINSSDDAILATNLQGIIRSWNAGAENIFLDTLLKRQSESRSHCSLRRSLLPRRKRFCERYCRGSG